MLNVAMELTPSSRCNKSFRDLLRTCSVLNSGRGAISAPKCDRGSRRWGSLSCECREVSTVKLDGDARASGRRGAVLPLNRLAPLGGQCTEAPGSGVL